MTLRYKALLILFSISLLSVTAITASLWFASVSESDAAAINVAGSLRMQSWRLAEHVVIPELVTEDILVPLVGVYEESLRHSSLAVLSSWQNDIGTQYRNIVQDWHGHMRPLLEQENFGEYVAAVPEYVDRLDTLVDALQANTEHKLRALYITMVVILGVLLVIFVVVARDIRRSFLVPVEELVRASKRVGEGDFSLDLRYGEKGGADSELGQLTRSFKSMADDLQRFYQSLERQVMEQTEALQHSNIALTRSNKALELLYASSRSLGGNPYDRESLLQRLEEWQELLELETCYVCLTGTAGHDWLQRVEPGSSQSNNCDGGHCSGCLNHNRSVGDDRVGHDFPVVINAGVDSGMPAFGFLKAIPAEHKKLTDEELQWLQVFVDILATALNQSNRHVHARKLVLMEERSVIARELHDSLAQSLSYQKIQIARLNKLLYSPDKAQPVITELKEGINSAYRQLRELLVTFRLSMAEGSLQDNLERALQEFRQRSAHTEFSLDYRVRFSPLNAHQEIHVLQIVREALNNVQQHANADVCRVSCYQVNQQNVQVVIEDDGCGLPQDTEKSGHYGMTIMRERANSLEGELEFSRSPLGGTRIQLTFAAQPLTAADIEIHPEAKIHAVECITD